MTNDNRDTLSPGRASWIAIAAATLAIVGAALLATSCAAKPATQAKRARPNADTAPSSPVGPDERPTTIGPTNISKRDQIRALWDQINQHDRTTASVAESANVCTAPVPKTASCTDVCQLRGSICDNSRRICEIARTIPDDSWAQNKCTEATAACQRATKRCCGCVEREK